MVVQTAGSANSSVKPRVSAEDYRRIAGDIQVTSELFESICRKTMSRTVANINVLCHRVSHVSPYCK